MAKKKDKLVVFWEAVVHKYPTPYNKAQLSRFRNIQRNEA